MAQILAISVVFIIAFGGMALALHFSKYKKRGSACCGGAHCGLPGNHHSRVHGSKLSH